jgi:hypothetical protein
MEMQNLLEEFNKIDHRKQGSIRLAEALRLVQSTSKIQTISEETISKVIFNVERQVSFD